ncbi:alpha/beta hydrolase [Pseudoalteromonas sp. JBTF-M23]|uniref:Alpha/beta hydrolase n=1 Tax=Pseudoalteromonas caenipelagi TaxID=2726988 RepID=A0A849VDJ7_9GAMM|nr:alpha/beta hydrolase [Pseudoalteromonas caenipelagi]NOU50860.1 alpha/beta hydrolase [Pseudoalteromonas caenipelagi]
MLYRIIIAVLVFLSTNSSASERFQSSYLAERSDGSNITYHLLKNNKEKSTDALLVILQGSSCNSALNIDSISKHYENVLPDSDLLLIEKYGLNNKLAYDKNPGREDCPVEYLHNDSPYTRVTDADIVLNKVKQANGYKKVVVVGGSEGAVVANLLAAATHHVNAVIAFNGGSRWFIDDVVHNITAQHQNQADAQQSINEFKGFAKHILNQAPKDIIVSDHGYKWWFEMLSIDQLSTLKGINIPTLIIQARADLNVSPVKVEALQAALSHKHNIQFKFYPELDHGFDDSKGESRLALVIKDMNEWVKKVL